MCSSNEPPHQPLKENLTKHYKAKGVKKKTQECFFRALTSQENVLPYKQTANTNQMSYLIGGLNKITINYVIYFHFLVNNINS